MFISAISTLHMDNQLAKHCNQPAKHRRLQNVCHREAKSWFRLLTDCGQSHYREQDHPYKEGSSLFRFHFSVANILQSPVQCFASWLSMCKVEF